MTLAPLRERARTLRVELPRRFAHLLRELFRLLRLRLPLLITSRYQ